MEREATRSIVEGNKNLYQPLFSTEISGSFNKGKDVINDRDSILTQSCGETVIIYDQATNNTLKQYDADFDTWAYQEILKMRFSDPQEYTRRKEQLNAYIDKNLITSIGERLQVLLSKRTDRIIDGKIYPADSDESMREIILRGIEWCKKNGSTPHDQLREEAELRGFEKIERGLTNPNTQIGTTYLFFSLPGGEGSQYQKNFYDIFTLEEENGQRVVKYRRYSSNLTQKDALERLRQMGGRGEIPENPTDIDLLANPIRFDPEHQFSNPDAIHQFLHVDHHALSEKEFEEIVEMFSPYRQKYIELLSNDPLNIRMRNLLLNAMINVADDAEQRIRKRKQRKENNIYPPLYYTASEREIMFFGTRPVINRDTGCRLSSGFLIGSYDIISGPMGVYSVYDIGFALQSLRPEDDPNLCRCGGSSPHFHCPGRKTIIEEDKNGKKRTKQIDCKNKIIVGLGIVRCPECGEGKKC
ncbi:MAG: hypothetical protein KatS3mg089_0036 [Patescibacteria group bacterium]|nr:MAG: hypothetical protein KatS3mg089_0036 [Patescibacteria group bacterium]